MNEKVAPLPDCPDQLRRPACPEPIPPAFQRGLLGLGMSGGQALVRRGCALAFVSILHIEGKKASTDLPLPSASALVRQTAFLNALR